MGSLYEIAASLKIDTKQFKSELGQADKGLNIFKNGLKAVNKTMQTVAIGGLAVLTAGLVKLSKQTVQTGMAFEKSMAQLAAVKGFTDGSEEAQEGIAKLEKTARELGKSTAYSATQASNAMIELGRAGLSASEISAAIAPSLYLAGSSASDLTSATSLMAATMKQFSLNTNDAKRVADVFTIAQQETMLSMESLTNAMRFAGTVGSAMGMSLEETTAAVGMFRDLGVQGATAGTQFRQMMISLANPTKKARDTLESYGLTIDDVNPQVKGFKGIIETLAKSNMDLADITNLVSKRASGSVTKLVDIYKQQDEAIDSTVFKYDTLLDKFKEGGGAAETTYNAMIDNVAGRFDILKSAFEEFQLTIYDTFADPLKEVLGADDQSGLIGLVNRFTEVFQASAPVFEQIFSQMFGETLKNINENQTEIATGFISIITQAARLGQTVVSLIPHFVTLFKVAVAWTVTAKVFAFAQGIMTLIAGVKGAIVVFGGLRAAILATIAASGGILPLIAGFATLVAVVTSFAMASSKAAKEQENMVKALNASKEAAASFNAERIKGERAGRGGSGGVARGPQKTTDLNTVENEIRLSGQLTDELERQFNTLSKMSEKSENKAIADGKMFSIMAAGKQILVDHAMALDLENTKLNENGEISKQILAKQEEINRQREEAKELYKDDLQAIEDVKEALRQHSEGLITNRRLGSLARQAAGNFSLELEKVSVTGSNANRVLQEMVNKLNASQISYTKADDAARNFNNDLAAAEEARRKAEAAADRKAKEEKKKRDIAAYKKLKKDREKAIKARIKLEENLQKQLDVLRAEDTKKSSVILQQQFENTKKIYDEELKFIGNNLQKRRELDEKYLETIQGITEQTNSKILESLTDNADEIEKTNLAYGRTEIKRIREETKAKIAEQRKLFDEIQANNAALATESGESIFSQLETGEISNEEAQAKMKEVEKKQREDDLAAQREFQKAKNGIEIQGGRAVADQINAINQEVSTARLTVAKQTVLQELKIEQDLAKEKLKEAGATPEQIAKLEDIFRLQRLNAEKELIQQFITPYGEYTDRIDELNKKSNKSFFKGAKERAAVESQFLQEKFELEKKLQQVRLETADLSPDLQAAAIGRVQNEIDNLTASFEKATSPVMKLKEILKNIGVKSIKALSKAFQGFAKVATGAIKGIATVGNELLSTFTGGTEINPFQMITGAAGKQVEQATAGSTEEQKKLEAALATGAISQEQFDQKSGELESAIMDPGAIAKEFVDNIVSEAKNMAMAIATQAPLIIAELAVAIPQLVDLLVENIPKVIIALGEGLPTVVLALVDGIIALLPVLADALLNNALPNIVDGLVTLLTEKIPQLAQTLLPIVQDLVQFILEAAPKIADAIVKGLPSVIDFLVQGITEILTGIPQLLKTLLAAIPTIITELLGGVADLVKAIFDAIPLILNEVILALPDIINSLLVGLLDVIVQIANELPTLINGIIKLIPTLLKAILKLIPQIIIALVEAIPLILEGLIGIIPVLIETIISLVPMLIVEIINALPMLISVLVASIFQLIFQSLPRLIMEIVKGIVEGITNGILGLQEAFRTLVSEFPNQIRNAFDFLREIPQKIGDSLREAFSGFKDFFKDVISEITSLGREETNTFGDTPGPILAGSSGLTASFAPNDYIIAAQKPLDLMKQAMQAFGTQIPSSFTSSVAKAFPPQKGDNTGGSTTTNVNIIAEGRLLDEIQITALERGHAPKLERKLKKNKGAKVGFNRGRYNQFSK